MAGQARNDRNGRRSEKAASETTGQARLPPTGVETQEIAVRRCRETDAGERAADRTGEFRSAEPGAAWTLAVFAIGAVALLGVGAAVVFLNHVGP